MTSLLPALLFSATIARCPCQQPPAYAVLTDRLIILSNHPKGFIQSDFYQSLKQYLSGFYNCPGVYISLEASNVEQFQLDIVYNVSVPCADQGSVNAVLQVLNPDSFYGYRLLETIGKAAMVSEAEVVGVKRRTGIPHFTGLCVASTTTTTTKALMIKEKLIILSNDPMEFASNPRHMRAMTETIAVFYGVRPSQVSLVPSKFERAQFDLDYQVMVPCFNPKASGAFQKSCCSSLLTELGKAAADHEIPMVGLQRLAGPPAVEGSCVQHNASDGDGLSSHTNRLLGADSSAATCSHLIRLADLIALLFLLLLLHPNR